MFQRLKRGGWPYSQPPNVPFEPNKDSEQFEGLELWMPWGGGTPGAHSQHVDRIHGRTFTEGGTPVWVSDGERGWSLLFDDGANEYLQGSTPVVDYPFSLVGWGRSNDSSANQTLVSIGDASAASPYVRLTFRGAVGGDPVAFVHWNGADAQAAETTTGYSINTWHHLAAVATSVTDRAVLIDGGSKGTSAANRALAGIDQLRIGVTADSTPVNYLSGQAMDVRVYNRALTDTQVYQIYANPWELWRPKVRRLWAMAPVAPPAGAMPMAMYDYRRRRV